MLGKVLRRRIILGRSRYFLQGPLPHTHCLLGDNARMASKTFASVPEKPNFPLIEQDVGKFWTEIDAFQESMRQSKAENRPIYTFYDGPP